MNTPKNSISLKDILYLTSAVRLLDLSNHVRVSRTKLEAIVLSCIVQGGLNPHGGETRAIGKKCRADMGENGRDLASVPQNTAADKLIAEITQDDIKWSLRLLDTIEALPDLPEPAPAQEPSVVPPVPAWAQDWAQSQVQSPAPSVVPSGAPLGVPRASNPDHN